MNYACKKVEILTLSLKYPTICKNLFQMTFVTCSDLGSPMQPEDHEMTLIGYSSSHYATLSLLVKLKFRINLQMLKIMLCKICLCCRLTNIQVYEWVVIILDTLRPISLSDLLIFCHENLIIDHMEVVSFC